MLLGSREQQSIEVMMSLKTDFEMHTYMQGYGEEHLRPVNAVTRLFGDGDLDADNCKVKASAAKEFVARKKPRGDCKLSHDQGKPQVEAEAMTSRAHELTRTIPQGKAHRTYWTRIECKQRFGNRRGDVKRQATINPDSRIWKSLEDSLPEMYCADLAEAYNTQGEYKVEACVKN
jgi:hypothetical protein